ncbi:MFS transporter [Silanimonas sp.]|uniref:MFS transporter n=1 Tax=Silanimonas sp. TaxID=1929290 RepID=UPI0022C92822|nr:MFS transporter [Silanimonas sp.]MCZ8166320.1 MFS transporter [Silanimonas sp.]
MSASGRAGAAALLIVLASFVQAVSVGINAVIFPTALESYGVDKGVIGAVMAIEFVSVFLVSGALGRMLGLASLYSWLLVSTAIRLPALLLLSFVVDVPHWLALVALHGLGNVLFGTLLQTWINSIPFERARGLSIALYGTAISVGLALGPVLVGQLEHVTSLLAPTLTALDALAETHLALQPDALVTETTRIALLLSAILSTLAALPLLAGRVLAPRFKRPRQGRLLDTLRQAPAVMFALALTGATILGLQGFITLYGMNNGLAFEQAALLLSAFMLGAIALEMPVAWVSDHFDRRYVMMALVLLSLVAAVGLPMAIYDLWLARGLLFVWGGVMGGLYSICLAVVAERFEGDAQVAANGMASIMEAVGGTVGMIAIGLAMQAFQVDGLPYVLMFACVLYFTFALTRYPIR